MTKILVVDDELAILDMLVAVLVDEGYSVVAADNGVLALALLPKEQPDLVILDIMMPGMDGREVCQRLRATPGLDSVPVVVISAANRPDLAGIPISAFVPKPFNLDRLLATVDRVLADKSRQEERNVRAGA